MKYGLAIVVVALMGAVLAGSMAIDRTAYTEDSYERVTDLTPIVEAGPVTGTLQYNPIRNVTGWTGVSYVTQNSPSIYSFQQPISPTPISYGQISQISSDSNYNLFESDATYLAGTGFAYGGSYPYIVWNNSTVTSGNQPTTQEEIDQMGWNPRDSMNGGISSQVSNSDQTTASVTVNVEYNGNTYTSDNYTWYWVSLNDMAINGNWATGSIITSNGITISGGKPEGIGWGWVEFSGNWLIKYKNPGGNYRWETNATETFHVGALSATGDFWWNADTQRFYLVTGVDDDGYPTISSTPVDMWWFSSDPTDTLSGKTWGMSTAVYVKPNTAVTISPGTEGTWSNGYANERVQILMSPKTQISVNGSGYLIMPAQAKLFDLILLTIDSSSEWYYQAVTSYNNPADFTVMPYQYPIEYGDSENVQTVPGVRDYIAPSGTSVGTFGISDFPSGAVPSITGAWTGGLHGQAEILAVSGGVTVDTWNFDVIPTGPISTISIINQTWTVLDPSYSYMDHSYEAAIINTWVPADPSSLLWQDPTINITKYFSNILNTGSITRVTISSAVTSGSGITIGGTTYPVEDGRITVDGKSYDVAGLSIDFQREGGSISYRLVDNRGEPITDWASVATASLTANGIWYFDSSLYEENSVVKTKTDVKFGQGSSGNWMIFAFIGICVMGIIGAVALGRGEMDIWDWMLIIGAIALGLVVIT